MFQRFILHGSCFTTKFPFTFPLAENKPSNQKAIIHRFSGEFPFESLSAPPVFINALPLFPQPVEILFFHQAVDDYLLRFTNLVDFHITPSAIGCHLAAPESESLVELYFLSNAISWWLEQQGHPVLHGAGIEINGDAIGFLAKSGQGKSSLAGSFVQAGYPLITDDNFSLHHEQGTFYTYPSYPCMRMWPDQAAHFVPHAANLELVHPSVSKKRVPIGEEYGVFGRFSAGKSFIRRLYLPQRAASNAPILIEPLAPAQALIELIRHSFTPRTVMAAGLQPRRIDFMIEFLKQAQVKRLIYPSGYEHLPRVRDAILEDLARL
jgi:hypothetical protein